VAYAFRMMNEEIARIGPLYSFISHSDFKAVLGIDDREDRLSRFCLVTASFTIEQYCKRRFLLKKHIDYLTYTGDYILTLRDYPVRRVYSVHAAREQAAVQGKQLFTKDSLVTRNYYYCLPDLGINEDIPFSLVLRPPLRNSPNKMMFKVSYTSGYSPINIPPDLSSACLELAAWNMGRYKARRIGMAGNVRGAGNDGEHFELSMPENVRSLLEPYKRRVI
jgi:hypothetical protein